MMKDDNIRSNHRGSSPPFVEPEEDFIRWMKGLKAIGLHDEKSLEIQRIEARRNILIHPTDLQDNSRWQDDGGEGG